MKKSSLHKFFAVLICVTMLLPGLVSAAAQSDAPWIPVDPVYGTDIPAYETAGSVSKELEYDCGNGLTLDGSYSNMWIVTNTSGEEFNAYKQLLSSEGFASQVEKTVVSDGNKKLLYARFLSSDEKFVLTVYYAGYSVAWSNEGHTLGNYESLSMTTTNVNQTFIIADVAEDIVTKYAGGYVHESITGETAKPAIVMYGQAMSENGYDISTTTTYATGKRDCGALVVIRMPDNSLFIHDGGDLQAWSDAECDEFMEFLYDLTGKKPGQKVVINSWFISHAHSDHFYGLPRFFSMHHEKLELQNVMYNFDSEGYVSGEEGNVSRVGSTRDTAAVMYMIRSYFPNATFYKPHTGESFEIAGVKFDVLCSQEDRFTPDAAGNLYIDTKDNAGTFTYHDFLIRTGNWNYSNDTLKWVPDTTGDSDFNDTSTVLRVTFPAEITGEGRDYTCLLYADLNNMERILLNLYSDALLAADITMVPHHGFDTHQELMEKAASDIYLFTQNRHAIYGPDGVINRGVDVGGTSRPRLTNNYMVMQSAFNGKTVYWAADNMECVTSTILFGNNAQHSTALSGNDLVSAPAGYTVYEMRTENFEYGGWTMDSTVVGRNHVTQTPVTTTTLRMRADRAKSPRWNDRLIIVHDATDNILYYDSVPVVNGTANTAVSLPVGDPLLVSKGEYEAYYLNNGDGTYSKTRIYFGHHYRDRIMWVSKQILSSSYGNTGIPTATGDDSILSYKNNGFAVGRKFGGARVYHHAYFYKGAAADDSYWIESDNYRRPGMGLGNPSNIFITTPNVDGKGSDELYIERFNDSNGDATFVFYFICKDANGKANSLYNVLKCNADGTWGIDENVNAATVKANLQKYKVRIYRYNELEADPCKDVKVSGYQDFHVLPGVEQAVTMEQIANQLTVVDNYRRNTPIPYRAVPTVGFYWLDASYDTNTPGNYTVNVKYRNDDVTDTVVGTLNLTVEEDILMHGNVTPEGFVLTGAGAEDSVYGEIPSADHSSKLQMSVAFKVDNQGAHETRLIAVTLNMLTCNEKSAVSTGQTLKNGAFVSTDVPEGTVYTNLTLTYNGVVICDNFTLTLVEMAPPAETEHTHNYTAVVTAPTCAEDGYTTYTCGCGDSYVADVTPAVDHSYVGGSCVYCGAPGGTGGENEGEPDVLPLPVIVAKSFSLSFEDEVLVNFYYSVSDMTYVVEHGLLVFHTNPGSPDYAQADVVYDEPNYDTAKARYGVTTAGIPAKAMGDTCYYAAFARLSNDIIVYSNMYEYSPKKYAMNMLAKDTTSDKQKALCVAMLNYGAAAQEYFGYNTDSLMNNELTDEQRAMVIPYDANLFKGTVAADANKTTNFEATSTGFGKKSATVSFEGAFCVNYYFTPNATVSGDMTLYIWTPKAYANAGVLSTDNAAEVITMVAGTDGRYWGQVSGIAAKELDETYYVAAVYSDAQGNSYCTGVIPYSLSKYCMNNASGTMGELAQATAMYGYYAKLFFTT